MWKITEAVTGLREDSLNNQSIKNILQIAETLLGAFKIATGW